MGTPRTFIFTTSKCEKCKELKRRILKSGKMEEVEFVSMDGKGMEFDERVKAADAIASLFLFWNSGKQPQPPLAWKEGTERIVQGLLAICRALGIRRYG